MWNYPFVFRIKKGSKFFVKRFHELTNYHYDLRIKWLTRKVRTLFRLKDPNPHPSCVIYQGECTCGSKYVGETKRNVAVRWKEHEDIRKDSEPAKRLCNHPNHQFQWRVISKAPKSYKDRVNLEVSLISIIKPSLNNKLELKSLILFKNGIT